MKVITAVLIGAGLRGGWVYAAYAQSHPEDLKIVAVAEPDEERRNLIAEVHGIPEERCYQDYRELLEEEKMADCALVCTQDTMHFEPVTKALEKGYHVLCEKPMSPDASEIVTMGNMAEKYGRILMICHVLRYSSFFSRIKNLIEEDRLGRLISIQHIEEVGYWHHAHSFVRGNWRRSDETSPMILQKCCHDMDILLWLAGSSCTKVSSFGDLTYFKEENAPEGAPAYCLDGCPHRDQCAFYAPKFYFEHPKAEPDGFIHAVSADTRREAVLEELKTGPYGRCVFHCDNNVVDHQVVNLEFENHVTVNMTMSAFTENCARRIHIMGTKGELRGNMELGEIEISDFSTGEKEIIQLYTPPTGHSGSDTNMMKDFVRYMREDSTQVRSGASVSVESHLIALAAEKSRVTGETVDLRESGKRQKGVNMDLRRFCTEIGLPFGAVRIVEKMNEEISEVCYQYVRELFFTDREEIFREIASLAGYRQRFLYYYCRLACETYDKYQRAGIGDRVFFDTFSDIAVWCQVCFRRYGEYGIQEYEWLWRHVEMTLFRLGRLQFEKTESLWEFEYKGRKTAVGDPVISIHIPEGQPLDSEACRESLDMGRKFWGGEIPYVCHSWLLFPGLKELLDEKSNILRFQQMFEIQSVDFQFREGEERIFDCLIEDPEKYPENTSLQRNARKYLMQGGRLGSGLGVISAD